MPWEIIAAVLAALGVGAFGWMRGRRRGDAEEAADRADQAREEGRRRAREAREAGEELEEDRRQQHEETEEAIDESEERAREMSDEELADAVGDDPPARGDGGG